MATLRQLLDDLNDRLNDPNDAAGAGLANKTRYLNHGLRAMYPKVYQTVLDSTLVVAADTYEYALPAVFANARLIRVEVETGNASNRYVHLYNFEIVPSLTDKILQLDAEELLAAPGARFRILAAKPLTEMAVEGDDFTGPPGTEEIPVWYALGLALSRRVEDRTAYTRYSTTNGQNGVDISEMMAASQFAFGQFELLLDRYEMPLPAQAG